MLSTQATTAPYKPFSEADAQMEALSNEALYASLVANETPLSEGLEILVQRLKPIIFNIARDYMPILSWGLSDALQEARILLWTLITKNRYRPASKVRFHNFFAKCFSNRLNKLYRDYLLRNPTACGSVMMGWEAHQPLVVGVVAFNEEYIERYRAAQRERNRRLYEKRLAEQGRTRQPELTAEEKAARKAAARQRAAERAFAWQQANREAYNARRAEIRREKAAGTFIDRRRRKVATV